MNAREVTPRTQAWFDLLDARAPGSILDQWLEREREAREANADSGDQS